MDLPGITDGSWEGGLPKRLRMASFRIIHQDAEVITLEECCWSSPMVQWQAAQGPPHTSWGRRIVLAVVSWVDWIVASQSPVPVEEAKMRRWIRPSKSFLQPQIPDLAQYDRCLGVGQEEGKIKGSQRVVSEELRWMTKWLYLEKRSLWAVWQELWSTRRTKFGNRAFGNTNTRKTEKSCQKPSYYHCSGPTNLTTTEWKPGVLILQADEIIGGRLVRTPGVWPMMRSQTHKLKSWCHGPELWPQDWTEIILSTSPHPCSYIMDHVLAG